MPRRRHFKSLILFEDSHAFSVNYNCIVPIETTASFNVDRKKVKLSMLKFGRSEVVNVQEVYNMFQQKK